MKSVKKSMIKVKFGENEKGPHISLKVRADASEVTQAIVELVMVLSRDNSLSSIFQKIMIDSSRAYSEAKKAKVKTDDSN